MIGSRDLEKRIRFESACRSLRRLTPSHLNKSSVIADQRGREAFSFFAYTDEAPFVLLLPLFERRSGYERPMAFHPSLARLVTRLGGIPILVFVQGNEQRMMNLDHTPFTVDAKLIRTCSG